MSGYKEFESKSLDEAISDACAYYDTTREKLEIEILNDAKGGIFGLMGAKKARIRARMVRLSSVFDDLDAPLGDDKPRKKRDAAEERNGNVPAQSEETPAKPRGRDKRQAAEPAASKPARKPASWREEDEAPEAADWVQPTHDQSVQVPAQSGQPGPAQSGPAQSGQTGPAQPARQRRERPGRGASSEGRGRRGRNQDQGEGRENNRKQPYDTEFAVENAIVDLESDADDLRRVPFDQLDAAELEKVTLEVVTRLTESFLGRTTIAVTIANDRVRVTVSDVDDPGLLIGRDGQTLASLQYLATRMVSNRMKALLRVQIDAGDYRERQDERLRELALSLAEKVKAGGRPQVTRPMSSYHRRVIHMTLQDDPLVQTHSKGEGDMKRVMVARRKPEKS